MRFSPMWFSIREKVVSNMRLAGGSLRALWLPPPPKTDIPYPPLLPFHGSLPKQTDSQLACMSKPNEIEVKSTARCGITRTTGKMDSHLTRNNLKRYNNSNILCNINGLHHSNRYFQTSMNCMVKPDFQFNSF